MLIFILLLVLVLLYIKSSTSSFSSVDGSAQSGGALIEGFGRGPRGIRGEPGPRGGRGPRGIPGPAGPQGPRGPRGTLGKDGPEGPVGPPGPEGVAGPKGDRGFDGFPGPQGLKGDRGDPGKDGERGPLGLTGPPGEKGPSGPRGFPGLKGDPGTFGEGSCKFFGSDEMEGWQCPDAYPIYAGGSMGQSNMKMYCSGGVAKNATCNGTSGTGAKAKTYTNNGQIVDVKITNGGRNYKYPPHIRIVSSKGYGAILKADTSNGSVTGITIVDGGQDYNDSPELQFETVDGGYGATASTIIDNGRVVSVNIVHTGQNYIIPPQIEFRGGGGKGASAVAEINEGHVISVRMSSGGAGYTNPPVVVITPGASKSGCSFCHMCCKRNVPKDKEDKQVQQQYESRIEQNEQDLQRLSKQLHDQKMMLELSMKSGTCKPVATVPAKEEPKQKSIATKQGERPPSQSPIRDMNQRRQEQLEHQVKQVKQDKKELNRMMLKTAEQGKGLSLVELDKYRQSLAKNPNLSGDEKIKRFMAEHNRTESKKYQDWAKLGVASQSSTKGDLDASRAIDGNLDTYNHTDITPGSNSWLKVVLPVNVEVQKIVVSNRLGNFSIRDRLAPFVVEVYNGLGAKVGSKRFTGTRNEYVWNEVELVGKTVRILQEQKNFLHVGKLSVFGVQATDCGDYERKYMKYRDLVDKILLDPGSAELRNKELYIKQRRLYQKLKDSCSKLDVTTKKERDGIVKERAKAYDKILNQKKALQKIKADKAKKLWVKMEKQLKKEQKTTDEAKKLGLPPPPPKYSQAQIAIVKKNLKFASQTLSTAKKARCMHLLNEAMSKKSKAEDYGRTAAFIPLLIPTAKKYGRDAERAWSRYNNECDNK